MKSKYLRKAWYLDEDLLIEGYVDKYGFHPNKEIQCGFGTQKITKKMIGKEIFFDLDQALKVCGNVIVISKGIEAPDYTIEELLKLGEERNHLELAKPLY